MALSFAKSRGAPDEAPMGEMNTTPLIDVMLVLLIMFIITIPIQTHAVKIDLPVPTDAESNVDPEKNKVMIDPAGTITWNGSTEIITLKLDRHYWPTYELRRTPAGWQRQAID